MRLVDGRIVLGVDVAHGDLVRAVADEDDLDVGVLGDPFADEVLADGGADGGDVVALAGGDDVGDGGEGGVGVEGDLGVVAADVLGNGSGPADVGGVGGADAEGGDLLALLGPVGGADGRDEAAVQTAGEEEAGGSIRVETSADGLRQRVANAVEDAGDLMGLAVLEHGQSRNGVGQTPPLTLHGVAGKVGALVEAKTGAGREDLDVVEAVDAGLDLGEHADLYASVGSDVPAHEEGTDAEAIAGG